MLDLILITLLPNRKWPMVNIKEFKDTQVFMAHTREEAVRQSQRRRVKIINRSKSSKISTTITTYSIILKSKSKTLRC